MFHLLAGAHSVSLPAVLSDLSADLSAEGRRPQAEACRRKSKDLAGLPAPTPWVGEPPVSWQNWHPST